MKLKHIIKKEHGQAMVEFALVLPILILLVVGIIDFGWIFYNQISANNASRETARYISIHYYFSSMKGETDPLDTDSPEYIAKTRIQNYVSPYITDINIDNIEPISDGLNGHKITVSFNGKVKILTPLLNTIFNSEYYTIRASCTMRAEE